MADYYSPTDIQPNIPTDDITAAELLLLTAIFDHQTRDGRIYFYSETGPSQMPEFDIRDVKAALAAKSLANSQVDQWFREEIAKSNDVDYVAIDMSTKSFEFVLQDIVRRSKTVEYHPKLTQEGR